MIEYAKLADDWLDDEMAANDIKCRFGCADPVGIYHIPAGCHCWPDPVQALCAQHFITAESTGPITLVAPLGENDDNALRYFGKT